VDSHYEKVINERAYDKIKAAGVSVAFAPYSEVLHSKSVVNDGDGIGQLDEQRHEIQP
jgi:hypothetical protein